MCAGTYLSRCLDGRLYVVAPPMPLATLLLLVCCERNERFLRLHHHIYLVLVQFNAIDAISMFNYLMPALQHQRF